MSKEFYTIQELTNKFNEGYAKAVFSSKPEDWMDAALTARQLINELAFFEIIEDNFTSVYRAEEKKESI